MPFTLTFHSLVEKTPQHGEQILYFSTGLDSFDVQQGNLRDATVEYCWDDVDGSYWFWEALTNYDGIFEEWL